MTVRSVCAAVVCLASTLSLGACGGGGASGGATGASVPSGTAVGVTTKPATASTSTSSRPTGVTVQQAMESGTIFIGQNLSTQVAAASGGNYQQSSLSSFQARNNFLGGVDISLDGEIFYLKKADFGADATSWSQTVGTGKNARTLAIWNAGKGERPGLTTTQEGQKYHKIVGYHYIGADGENKRGHSIIGAPTPASNLSKLPRQISYDGYYVAKAIKSGASGTGADIKGSLALTADFDRGTVQGRAREVLVKYQGSLGAINYGHTMSMSGSISGATYSGSVSSSLQQMNGAAVNGAFFGAGAQETAGTLTNSAVGTVTEGFFTATDPKAK